MEENSWLSCPSQFPQMNWGRTSSVRLLRRRLSVEMASVCATLICNRVYTIFHGICAGKDMQPPLDSG